MVCIHTKGLWKVTKLFKFVDIFDTNCMGFNSLRVLVCKTWWESRSMAPGGGSPGDLVRGQGEESGQGGGTKITSHPPHFPGDLGRGGGERGRGLQGRRLRRQLLAGSTRGRQGLRSWPVCPSLRPGLGGKGRGPLGDAGQLSIEEDLGA